MFWKTAGAIREAGYGSVLSLIQETATAQSPVPLLTREGGPGSRGTRHLRILIPVGIKGITECERATLQAWLELVDWTGLEVLPGSQVPRKMKLNMDSKGAMHQWLALAEQKCGITDQENAQMFTNNGRELAKAIREQTPNASLRKMTSLRHFSWNLRPGSQVPRKMKLNMDSKGAMHQWLALVQQKCGITDQENAQMFTNNGREELWRKPLESKLLTRRTECDQ